LITKQWNLLLASGWFAQTRSNHQ